MEIIRFYEGHFYMLSNFSSHEVKYEGNCYKTAEHAYQVAKFQDSGQRKKIADASSAFLAREFGQSKNGRKQNFDKVSIMKDIMRSKLEQHKDVQEALLQTGNAIIKKNHPKDVFWGTGTVGDGKNVMGKIWMELRDELRHSQF